MSSQVIVHNSVQYLPPAQWLLLSAMLLIPILITHFLRSRRNASFRGLKHFPPGPPKLPILGNLHLLAGKIPHQAMYTLSQKYGPAMLLQLGNINTLIISNAEMAREVLHTHDADFCSRPKSPGPKRLSYGYLDIIFSSHSNFRTELRKLFSSELLKKKREQSIWNARVDEMTKMIENITQLQSTSIHLNDHVFALMDRIIGQVAFGKWYGSMHFKGRTLQEVMNECMNLLNSFTAEDFYPDTWAARFADIVSGQNARLEKLFSDLDGYFTVMIDQHLDPKRSPLEAEGFVDVLLRLTKEGERELKLSIDHVKSILMNTFIGSVDTTAVSVVWAMSELLLHPNVLKKATTEVRRVTGKKGMVEEMDLKQLKYINCIVKEIFRLHPPAPLLVPHEAINSTKIGKEGYDVLENTRIIINAFALGRDPAYWTDPAEFKPERFEESDVDFKGGHFQLIPFGSGRRICPGMAMGFTSVTYTIANLLHCFDWELPKGLGREDVNMEEQGGLTMHKKTPLVVVPTRILQ